MNIYDFFDQVFEENDATTIPAITGVGGNISGQMPVTKPRPSDDPWLHAVPASASEEWMD